MLWFLKRGLKSYFCHKVADAMERTCELFSATSPGWERQCSCRVSVQHASDENVPFLIPISFFQLNKGTKQIKVEFSDQLP